jgi:hypothetical protein
MRGTRSRLVAIAVFGACVSLHLVGLSAQNAATPDAEEYKFVEDTSRWIMVIQGETESIGKLDAAGNFVPDKRWFQLRKLQPLSSPGGDLINAPDQKGVYEFRSGRLIPGDIDDKCNFIPTVGGRIIEFKDYRYSPKAATIYNLPGKFVGKEKKDKKR